MADLRDGDRQGPLSNWSRDHLVLGPLFRWSRGRFPRLVPGPDSPLCGDLTVEADGATVRLRLSGGEGVGDFLRATFGEPASDS